MPWWMGPWAYSCRFVSLSVCYSAAQFSLQLLKSKKHACIKRHSLKAQYIMPRFLIKGSLVLQL